MPDISLQCQKVFAHSACCGTLDLPVTRNKRSAEWSEHCAAAILAPGLAIYGTAANPIDLVDQIPGPLI